MTKKKEMKEKERSQMKYEVTEEVTEWRGICSCLFVDTPAGIMIGKNNQLIHQATPFVH